MEIFNNQELLQQLTQAKAQLKEADESLQVALKQISEFEQATDNVHLAIIKLLPCGKVEYVNPFAFTLFDPGDGQSLLNSILKAITPPGIPVGMDFAGLIRVLVESYKNFYRHESKITTKEKDIIWISWTIQFLFDVAGTTTGLVALGSDITNLKQTENALRQNEFVLKKAHEISKTGSWVWTAGTDNLIGSELFFQIFGITPTSSYAELLSKLEKIILPEYLDFIKSKIHKALTRGTTDSYTYKIMHPSGFIRWIVEEVCLLPGHESNAARLVGTVRDITAQKETEEKLREYLLIVSSSSELMSLISPDYRYINVNQAYIDAYQKPISQIEGHTVAEMFGEEVFQQLIKPNIDRCLLGETISDQYWSVYPDGGRRFMDVKYNPVREIDGMISGVTVSTRDITELIYTEEQLRIFRMFAEESGVGFGMASLDGRITYINSTLCSLAGFSSPQEIIGKSVGETYLKDHQTLLRNEIIPIIRHKGHWTGEIDMIRSDGNTVYTIQNFFLIRNELEEPVSYALSVTNITDRKIAEQALQRSETNFRSIFTNAAIGIDVVDEKGKFLQVNRALAEMLGYTQEELIQLKIADITFPEDTEPSICSLYDLFSGKNDSYRLEKRYTRKDGSIFWADISVTIYHDIVSQKRFAIGTIIDITQSKTLQQQLERSREEAVRANMAKSEFLANMSHEIRTPLNAVIGFTELLETMVTDKKQISYLESIKSGGKNLLLLINDILDLSKIEAGKMSFKYEPVNPHTLINEIKQIFSLKIEDKNLEFIIDVDPGIPASLVLDEVRVRQVIFNLIGNAIKFTDQGYVKFSVKKTGSESDSSKIDLKVSVEDTGIGIPSDQHQIIFDAFQQQSGHNTRKYGGTGLGLSISKRLVEMMGGNISLHSEPGKGSNFSFTLKDVAVGASIEMDDGSDELDTIGLVFHPAAILIVDDVESNRNLIRENLTALNFNVLEAEDGSQAVQMAVHSKPDLIFMDIRMPVMDGFEATKIIKSNPETREIVVVALTASLRNEDQKDTYQHFFDGYLHKPVTRTELYRELMKFLPYEQHSHPALSGEDKSCQFVLNGLISIPAEKIDEFIRTLDKQLMKKWDKAYSFQLSDEMKDFAESVIQAGKQFEFPILTTFGEEFLVALDNFELDTMENCLKNFPKLVQQIKNHLHNQTN